MYWWYKRDIVSVCVCVREREREREVAGRDKYKLQINRVCDQVRRCVYVWEREIERERKERKERETGDRNTNNKQIGDVIRIIVACMYGR